MAGMGNFLKALFIPAAISLALYLLLTYVLLPLYRRHHARYNQYLPLHIPSSIQSTTTTFRSRLSSSVRNLLFPSYVAASSGNGFSFAPWRGRGGARVEGHDENVDGLDLSDSDEEELFSAEEGERMIGFGSRRSEHIGRRHRSTESPPRVGDVERRLSRELEEGFRDDSDDEGEDRRLSLGDGPR